jgi:UDP-N-acetylbacillosamine N-acetyltransferase
MSNLLIWGAGGHGKVVLDIAIDCARFKPIHFVDDNCEKSGKTFCHHAIIGGPQDLIHYAGSSFVIAVGDNLTRARCFEFAKKSGLTPVVLVHTSAVVSPSASIGEGTVVMPRAVVNAGSVVGQNCIINSGAIVEHDCEIGAHVHISPGAVLGGAVRIENFAHVGSGAVVLPCAWIGEESVVGAGAVVLKSVPARCTVVGIPAKQRNNFV